LSNVRNGNTFFIDTQYSASSDELVIAGVRVPYIIVSSSATTNQVILSDSVTGINKIKFQNIDNTGNAGDTRVFDFSENPILFPNGIRPTTLTKCVVTCVIINPTG
jgi:hypothetical protein